MKRLFSAKSLAVAAVVLGAVGLASVAHAGTDVFFSIGVNAPYGYVQPARVYVDPQPVYVQPARVYVDPQPVYVQPRPVYVQPQPVYYGHDRRWERRGAYGDWDRDGIPNRFDRDSRHYDPRVVYRQAGWSDRDHDGMPNRYDRFPANPYRR
jgi:PXPV repeat-containing protein